MKTKIISLLVLIAIAVVSCQKDEATEGSVKQDVAFGITQVNPNNLKNDPPWDFSCDENLIASIAEIEIAGETYYPQIFWLNGELYTQAIKLFPGTHTITKFVLWTEHPVNGTNPQIVMATPNDGADFAQYVANPVSFDIQVSEFDKVEVLVDVICFIPEEVDGFGFFWFAIDEIIVREQCFFGDLCIKAKADYEGSFYDDIFNMDDYPFDLPAIFKVKLERNDGWEQEFMNIDIVGGIAENFQAPLCIQYPDRVGVTDVFTATLYVYVAQGDAWEFVEFKTWSFNDYYIDELTQPGEVIDFVIGYCTYNPNEEWVFPPWINLPQTANITIDHDFNYLYWRLKVNSVIPFANTYDMLYVLPPSYPYWTSFCGDGAIPLSEGTFNFHIYNTLYYDKWHLMPNATKEEMDQVHWLINNLGTYGYDIASQDPLYILATELTVPEAKQIQDAIWIIINGLGASGVSWSYGPTGLTPSGYTIGEMADAAINNGTNFKPMPGQWSSVLVLKDDNPAVYQVIFTVLDP